MIGRATASWSDRRVLIGYLEIFDGKGIGAKYSLQRAAELTPSERLLLANRLIQGVRKEMPLRQPSRKWKDAAGLLNYPSLGEDAQAYISRSRRTDDEHRFLSIRDGE